ncbi:MAG: outer membrane protein assembly factor BamC [Candidatus Protistobacter heckmanni]|nr:outer membrane protein assembly factor BamC [Candidatus Protistobacter heckmanni]
MRIFARRTAAQTALVSLTVLAAGCSSWSEPDRVDYKSATKVATPSLQIPPDLTTQRTDRRYTIPGSGLVTASDYAQQNAKAEANAVLPTAPGMRIERNGTQRWLVVDRSPAELWPQLRDFWSEQGFVLNLDKPDVGLMETDWAENRSKLPQDLIRRTLGKLIDSVYDTGERDKFRTRVERSANGGSEIYITHQGLVEELIGPSKDRTQWTQRPVDPNLEAEFIAKLMSKLGASKEAAGEAAARFKQAGPQVARVSVLDGVNTLQIADAFDRAWRSIGLALDRVSFTVEDRDRSKGIYYVRYVDTEKQGQEKGFFGRLFSSGSNLKAAKYQIKLAAAGNGTAVTVLNEAGKPESGDVSKRILTLLDGQAR